MRFTKVAAIGMLVLLGGGLAVAGWNPDRAENLAIADRDSEQVVPKVAATPDGGCFIGWFDLSAGSYQVYLQLLDAHGTEQWVHNGILVSDKPQDSWLTDWDLICDSAGNAVLAFVDIRAGGDFDVYAYRISPAGTFLWGADGVPISINADFDATPRVAELSDGSFLVVWSAETGVGVQKLSATGEPQFGATGFVITGPGGETPGWPRAVASLDGSFIVSWVRDMSYMGTKHVRAQRYDAAGQPMWGTAPLSVFDLASVPMAYEPVLRPDGAGGAIVAWHYSIGMSNLDIGVQRLTAAGVELFPHNGVAVSLQTARHHIDPAVAFAPAADEIFVFWDERSSSQGQRGIFGQRLSPAGERLWGVAGLEIAPVDAVLEDLPRALPLGDGAVVLYLQQPAGSTNHHVAAARLKATGEFAWGPAEISTVDSAKSRLPVARTAGGMTIAAWEDSRKDFADVYAQNVNPNGTLGQLGDLNGDCVVNAFDIDPFVLALTDPAQYAATYPECQWLLADCNGDGKVDAFDIDPFVAVLTER